MITACLAVMLYVSEENISECSATLVVEKNRSSKSADEEGAQFILILTNTSRDTKSFNLSTKNLSEPCNNKTLQYNRGTHSKNSVLDVSFQSFSASRNRLSNELQPNIKLDSGESYKFIVNVTVPKGTPYNTWSCIEVGAISTDCESTLDTETLSVFVVDPSEG